MLQINPSKRISVEEALNHPFMESLHYDDDEPTCSEPLNEFDFNFEKFKLSLSELKKLIYEEVQIQNDLKKMNQYKRRREKYESLFSEHPKCLKRETWLIEI